MDRMCRLCLTSETGREFERIFGNQNQKIALKIFLISQIKIIEIDEYQALICPQCVKELYQCFLFRKKIQTSDEYFRSKLEVVEENLWRISEADSCNFEEETIDNYIQEDNNNECDEEANGFDKLKVTEFRNTEIEDHNIEALNSNDFNKDEIIDNGIQDGYIEVLGNNALIELYCEYEALEEIDEYIEIGTTEENKLIESPKSHQSSSLIPPEEHFLPPEEIIIPTEEPQLPSKEILLPNEEPLLPSGEPPLPIEEIPSPIPARRGRKVQNTIKPYKRLTCDICGITLSRRQRLIQHQRLHYLDSTKLYECDLCEKVFNQRYRIIPHFQKYHNYKLGPKERWKCAICEDRVITAGKMECHYMKFHSEFCAESNFQESNESPKRKLLKNYKVKKPRKKKVKKLENKTKDWFVCSLCGNSFTCNYRYQKHLNDIHGVAEHEIIQKEEPTVVQELKKSDNVPCQTCGKSFASLSTCKAHEKTHLDLQFICDICGKDFKIKVVTSGNIKFYILMSLLILQFLSHILRHT